MLLGVHFVNNKVGWAVGESGTIFKRPTVERRGNYSPRRVICFTIFTLSPTKSDTRWRSRRDIVYEKWRQGLGISGQSNERVLWRTYFINEKVGWAVAEFGTILHTKNGGRTWESQESNSPYFLLGVFFVDERTGWAIGNGGAIIHTSDGGKTWVAQNSGVRYNLFGLHFVDTKTGWSSVLTGHCCTRPTEERNGCTAGLW